MKIIIEAGMDFAIEKGGFMDLKPLFILMSS